MYFIRKQIRFGTLLLIYYKNIINFYQFKLTKQKEAMVMKFAVGEKNLLEMRQQKEQFEKKLKDAGAEKEIMHHKVQMMSSEKERICQMLDNKRYEHKNSQQELEQLKADFSALGTKLKWTQTNLKTEMQLHKVSKLSSVIVFRVYINSPIFSVVVLLRKISCHSLTFCICDSMVFF